MATTKDNTAAGGQALKALAALQRREVITTDPAEAQACCGSPRDDDGFCIFRPYHPIYVDVTQHPHEES